MLYPSKVPKSPRLALVSLVKEWPHSEAFQYCQVPHLIRESKSTNLAEEPPNLFEIVH